jgi:hypothetical protein
MGLHQIKKFLHIKRKLPETRENPKNGRKIFANYSNDKELISRIHKELKN